MPKQRFNPQYSKPKSTVHPSLGSTHDVGQKKDAAPTVNELINSSRKSAKAKGEEVATPSPSLPPQIRQLLSLPETPALSPRSRVRRRFDANGRPLPAGPPPPKSWLERSRHAPEWIRTRQDERPHPTELYQFPGLERRDARSLQSMCMRRMAREWEYVRGYEQNNLAELPTALRMELLSHIAVSGPDDGIGFEGLRSLLVVPDDANNTISESLDKLSISSKHDSGIYVGSPEAEDEWDAESPSEEIKIRFRNDNFYRLDISGSIGHSISFRQLTAILERPAPSLPAPLPHLTHLSLSHPSPTISWRSLLAFSKQVPTLTHLSLAYWPIPTLTPNSTAAVMSLPHGKDIQYGGTNFYSHTLDNDFREAADVLRRLSNRLYALEYLDLTGCSIWFRALRWTGIDLDPVIGTQSPSDLVSSSPSSSHLHVEGINWRTSWLKLHTLKLTSEITLEGDSHFLLVSSFAKGIVEAKALQKMMGWWMKKGGRKGCWVDVECDDKGAYEEFWRGKSDEERKLRALLGTADNVKEVEDEIVVLNSLMGIGGERTVVEIQGEDVSSRQALLS